MDRSELERCEWCYLADGPALGNVILFNPVYRYEHTMPPVKALDYATIFGSVVEREEPTSVIYTMYDTDFGGTIGFSGQHVNLGRIPGVVFPRAPQAVHCRARLEVICNLEWRLATKELSLEQDTPPEIVYDMLLEMDRSDKEWAEMFAAVKYLIRRDRFTKMEGMREQ